jgi:kynurenine--oxoglutarate transaminase/cysteine-S-conjugate beta-lyase/glutamine--phenylpyruvate transaminase
MAVVAGAKCVCVPLRPRAAATEGARSTSSSEWTWTEAELEAAFNSKTRVLVLNTPNNPLGKVFTRRELEKLAELCVKHDVVCISDEVYEHLSYDRDHIRIGSFEF